MRKKLQDIRDSNYERPQQPWVCGLAAEGICCPLGPNGKGVCHEGAACLPILEDQRWTCGRPNSSGGTCEEGPTAEGLCCHTLSCKPVASQRVRRGRWIAGCLLFTVGLLLVVFASPWRNEILAPGPLSQGHAQIIRREDSLQRCATCHPNGNANAWEMCRIGLGIGPALGPPQWELCLKCHEKMIPAAHALAAHSVPRDMLQVRTRPMLAEKPVLRKGGFEITSLPTISTKRDELQCSACHQEHQGASHSLVEMTSAQCQTCHQQTFASLSQGHPEFENWPYREVPHVKFNHRSHAGKHFAQAKRDFNCATCHIDDPQKNAKLVANYSQTCASCHEEKINASALGGIVLLRLPSLDLAALKNAGEKIDWPTEASGDFDGPLPWGMQLLLSADAEVAAALPALGTDADFANLRSDKPEDLKAASTIARGIRRLFDDLAERGHVAVEERLEQSQLRTADRAAAKAFTQGLSPETLATLSNWFAAKRSLSGVMSSKEGTIVLAAFEEGEEAGEGKRGEGAKGEEDSDDDLLVDDEPAQAPPSNPLRGSKSPQTQKPEVPDDDDLLLDSPNDMVDPPSADADLLTTEEGSPAATPAELPAPLVPAPLPTPARFTEQWRLHPLPRGVWFADPLTFTLRYVPSGHADPVLSAWLEAAAGATDSTPTSAQAARESLYLQATDPQAQGLCFQCHTTQPAATASAGRTIAWQPEPFERQGFTRFSHRPHLIQPNLADCSHCHQLRSAVTLTASEVNFPSSQQTRDFEPIGKRSCVTCHTASAAGDGCLQCHRYHVSLDALK